MDRPGGERPGGCADAAVHRIAVPGEVCDLLAVLWTEGHAGFVVGGSLRDVLLGRTPSDWDLTTDARPDRVLELFPGSVYENRFGTVGVRRDGETYEITTFRSEHDYADFRRPHRVEFGDRIELDLARRDFTVNAMAWGRNASTARDAGADTTPTAAGDDAADDAVDHVVGRAPLGLVDPFAGQADLAARLLRAVGEPDARFREDALRMVRAVRLAATLEFEIEPATLGAIAGNAELVRHLSGERIAAELFKLLAAPHPSVGLRLMADTGLLGHLFPELAAQRGVPQNKIEGEDLWDHTLRSVDAAPVAQPIVRLAALLHDIGKPATAADGHFYGHERVGADMTQRLLERIHAPRAVVDRVTRLVRAHMFAYRSDWSDAAIRRFIRKHGGKAARVELDELFALRAADNVGSGQPPDATGLAELRNRVEAELAGDVALDRSDLAVDGNDLIRELGLEPGPAVGRLLDGLLERVIADPSLNDRPTLLALAQAGAADER